MDYMQELASHPDMPQALNALRLRWAELFTTLQPPRLAVVTGSTVLTREVEEALRRGSTNRPGERRSSSTR